MFMQLYQKIDRKLVHQNQNPSKHNIHIVVTIWQYWLTIAGIIGMIWCIFWMIFSFEKPSTNPHITQEERIYIETSIAESGCLVDRVCMKASLMSM